jgi:hypothetical protein
LPLVAIYTLDAGPLPVAILGAANVAPGLLLGLFAGVWVDRLRRRPLLIAADIGRALALASVPLAARFGVLGMAQLYLVAMITSALSLPRRLTATRARCARSARACARSGRTPPCARWWGRARPTSSSSTSSSPS